jgi:hypothetical protein
MSFDRVSGRGAAGGVRRSISNHPTPRRAGLSGGKRFRAARAGGRGGRGRTAVRQFRAIRGDAESCLEMEPITWRTRTRYLPMRRRPTLAELGPDWRPERPVSPLSIDVAGARLALGHQEGDHARAGRGAGDALRQRRRRWRVAHFQ